MRVSRARGGAVRMRLEAAEAQTLATLVGDLITSLQPDGLDHDDPVFRRLYPDGYQHDVDAAGAFRDMTESSLRTERLDRARQCLADLTSTDRDVRHRIDVTIAAADAERWLRVLNDMRLAVGTRIGVSEDDEFEIDPGAEDAVPRAMYLYLTAMQDAMVRARMG